MPFYRMMCIAAHYPEYKHIKDLVTQSAMHVLDNGGIVRGFRYWGTRTLPQKMRRQKQIFNYGDYWFMHFDASPKTLKGLHTLLRKDPRVIRWTMLKEGEKVQDVVELKDQTIEHSSPFDSVSSAPTSSPVSSLSSPVTNNQKWLILLNLPS
ncbi:ribosomal protein S6 [Thelephora terrestris]|uniref:Ribosomal protein S6 n=1 Tax=Thelephora terrestris TaxID=56493 RepID=A0A9P6LCI0_9AGAM|nr:ribosomal protein S6 [Thelephora terrestris]